MRSVHIGICHNDNLMIAKLCNIKILVDSCSEGSDHCLYFCIGIDFIKTGFFYIQNFTSERKNCLRCTISCCFCRTSGRITLNNINFTVFRIFVRTVCQFSGKRHSIKGRFTSRKITGFSCRFPCSLGKDGFFYCHFCNRRILLQENFKLSADNAVYRSSRFAVSQFLLCLSLKLRIFYFHTYDCCKSLSNIISA